MERRVVVLLHHGLGDVIMSRKLITNLRYYLKDEKIILVVKSKVEMFFLKTLCLDSKFEIVVLNYSGTFISKVRLFLKFFSLRLNKIDILFAVHSTNNMLGNIFSKMLRAKISIGPEGGKYYSKTLKSRNLHKKDYYLGFLLTYLESFRNYRDIEFKEAEVVKFKDNYIKIFPSKYRPLLNNSYIIISPGTSVFDVHKRWPSENFISLIREILNKTKCQIIILGTISDNQVIDSIYNNFMQNSRVFRVNDLSIKNAMFLISKSKVLVSACTSSLHMADCVLANTICLYGPTNYSITGPISKKNRIVRLGYSCSPCFRDNFTLGCGTPRCMTDIKVDDVMDALTETMMNKEIPTYPKIFTTKSKQFQI